LANTLHPPAWTHGEQELSDAPRAGLRRRVGQRTGQIRAWR